MDEHIKSAIIDALVAHLTERVPTANPRPMYGGTVFELVADTPKSRIGGVYAYEAHVSLELAEGATLEDPLNVLEGGGKRRRHIKLRSLSDIEDKRCFDYLDRAVALHLGS